MDSLSSGDRPNAEETAPEIRLIDFNDFKALNEFPRFPENADLARPLRTVDIDNSFVVFISHCWLRGWPGAPGYASRPHPDNSSHDKFSLCISGIEKMVENFAFQLENCYVWLDFGCINQNSDPAGELKQLDEIVRCSDCIFTPIVDTEEWDLVHTSEGFFVDYKAKAWNAEVHGYLNRGWCRLEMFYAANIPIRASPKVDLFAAGLKFATKAGRRPHILYGSREEKNDSQPIVLDPLQNSYFEKYHPMKGSLSVKDDCDKIESLVKVLLPYMTFSRVQYEGDMDSSGRRHGNGTLTFEDGNRYTGQFAADRMSGIGEYVFANGDRYDGDFDDDLRNGYGVFSFANGNTYSGDFVQGKYDGYGTYSFANGDVYSGEWKDGKKHGYGVFSCVSGFNYDGEWRLDKRDGFATFTSSNGDMYTGDFVDNLEEGFGAYHYAGGDRYEGQFVAGKKHGYGFFSYSDGDKYEGDFEDDRAQGKGRFRYFNEDTYEGEIVSGFFEGHGTYQYADGRRYTGEYKANLKHGKGIFYFGRGDDRVECMFEDDKCSGPAVCIVQGHRLSVILEGVDPSSLIKKYYLDDADSASREDLQSVPALLTRISSSSAMSTRTLVQTSKGLRYYCNSHIDSLNQFYNGEQRWCSAPAGCNCGAFCGPTAGCQCSDCYRMTFPSEFPSSSSASVYASEATCGPPLQVITPPTGSSPACTSKWGRLRMAVFSQHEVGGNPEDSLPPPPSLLSTRGSRIPSSGNLMAPSRAAGAKVHVTAPKDHLDSVPYALGDSSGLAAVASDALPDIDDDDFPPPPPTLLSSKSRSSYSNAAVRPPVAVVGSKWSKLRSRVKDISLSAKDAGEGDNEGEVDLEDPPPPALSLVSVKSTSSLAAPSLARSGSSLSGRRASCAEFAVGHGFSGSMKDKRFDGYGKLVYKGGAVYLGDFIEGRRSGDGQFTYSLVSAYIGSYRNGKRHGNGRMEYSNGSSYKGEFVHGLRDGSGTFSYADGGSYEGMHKEGLYEGKGVHIFPNGNKYEGVFSGGRRHGKGAFLIEGSSCSFVGEFTNGEFTSGIIYRNGEEVLRTIPKM